MRPITIHEWMERLKACMLRNGYSQRAIDRFDPRDYHENYANGDDPEEVIAEELSCQ